MVRLRHFLIHLGLSLVLCALIGWALIGIIFPMPYFLVEGGMRIFLIASGIVITGGPLLTLIVANPQKPRRVLSRDFAVIGTLQLIVFAVAFYVIVGLRTEAVIFADGVFYTMNAKETAELGGKYAGIAASAKARPVMVVVDLPDSLAERSRARSKALAEMTPAYMLTALYAPMDESRGELTAAREDPLKNSRLAERPEAKANMERFLAGLGGAPQDHLVYPLAGRAGTIFMALSARDFSIEDWTTKVEVRY